MLLNFHLKFAHFLFPFFFFFFSRLSLLFHLNRFACLLFFFSRLLLLLFSVHSPSFNMFLSSYRSRCPAFRPRDLLSWTHFFCFLFIQLIQKVCKLVWWFDIYIYIYMAFKFTAGAKLSVILLSYIWLDALPFISSSHCRWWCVAGQFVYTRMLFSNFSLLLRLLPLLPLLILISDTHSLSFSLCEPTLSNSLTRYKFFCLLCTEYRWWLNPFCSVLFSYDAFYYSPSFCCSLFAFKLNLFHQF